MEDAQQSRFNPQKYFLIQLSDKHGKKSSKKSSKNTKQKIDN